MAAQAGLCLTWPQTPKAGFLVTWLICSREVVRDALVGALDVSVSDGTLEPGVCGRRW